MPNRHPCDRQIDNWSSTHVVNHYILSGQMLHAAGPVMMTQHQTSHRPREDAVSSRFVKQMGNVVAKWHFKGTCKAPYAVLTPAQYRYFTVFKVMM